MNIRLTVVLALLMCSLAAASQDSISLNRAKLTDPDVVIAPLQQGEEVVRVTINLYEPEGLNGSRDFRSRKSMSTFRDKIHTRQKEVMSGMSMDESFVRHRFENMPSFSAEVSESELRKLSNNPNVESIEPVIIVQQHLSQGISLMNAVAARSIYNGAGMSIAICDTGVDYTHPALGGGSFPNDKVIGGYDFGDDDSDPMPVDEAHGTCCAGIAAGDVINYGDYIGGVACGAKIYALKISPDSSGSASSDDMVAAWDWCVTHQNDDPDNPIMVISTSFGGGQYFSTCNSAYSSMTTAANNAVAAGITVLASSGNEGYCNAIAWPSCIGSVISVGAVYDASLGFVSYCVENDSCAEENTNYSCGDSSYFAATQTAYADVVCVYSNAASILDILAPSNDAYTPDIVGTDGYNTDTTANGGDYYSEFGGTSAACPYAAGAVAVIQSAAKEVTGSYLTPAEIRTLLTSTGDYIADEKIASIVKPRINVENAVLDVLRADPPQAYDVEVSTRNNIAVNIKLDAADDGLPYPPGEISYIITSLPNHGELTDPRDSDALIESVPYTLLGPEVDYTPYSGCDAPATFTYIVNDGGVEPEGGDSNEAAVTVDITDILLENDFEEGVGIFTIDNTYGNGSGLWHLSNSCDSELSGHSPAMSIHYGADDFCDYDSGNTEGVAESNIITLPDFGKITLQFNYFLETEGYPGYDVAKVEISRDGASYILLASNQAGTLGDPTDGWLSKSIDLSDYAGSDVRIRFHFKSVDEYFNTFAGYYIDDVEILAPSYESVEGDMEPDCDVDTDDLGIIIVNWLASCGDCDGADLDSSGIVDLVDLASLAANWLVGAE